MSDVIEAAVISLNEKMSDGFDGLAKFIITGEGAVMVDNDGARASNEADDEEADVTLTASPEAFGAMMSGDLNPTSAFMTGKLSVDGNMGLAMKLGSALT